jgi:hypothetical protein
VVSYPAYSKIPSCIAARQTTFDKFGAGVSSHSTEREMHDGTSGDVSDVEIEAMILARPCSRIRREAQASQKTRWDTKKHI